jgi:hypothetical protein
MKIKWLILLGLFAVVYYGFDGLAGDHDLTIISLEDAIGNGVENKRFLEITGCYPARDFVYEHFENSDAITDIIVPMLTRKEFIKYVKQAEQLPTCYLFVKRNRNKYESNCMMDSSCVDDLYTKLENVISTGITMQGLTLIGLDNIDSETKSLIKTAGYNLPSNVLFLEEDAKPRGIFLSILMILGGIAGSIIYIIWLIKMHKQNTNLSNT